jgi:surface polysaccharide O-acyltransferase-like enzyme
MLNRESSLRLSLLRFPLIIGVVFIHNQTTTISLAGRSVGVENNSFLTDFARHFISQGIAQTAVPLFFMMSGYLFFIGTEWSKEKYIEKLKSRLKTLLIPFLFWNISTLLLIAFAELLPATQSYFSGKNQPISHFSITDYISAIFGIGRMPIAYQFWFIRDLMVLVLLTPVIHFIHKKALIPLLSVLFFVWLSSIFPDCEQSLESTLFFSIGCLLAIRKRDLFITDKYGKIFLGTYLCILLADASFIRPEINTSLDRIDIIPGILSALFITHSLASSPFLKTKILSVASASFFVFAAHEPVLTIARKIAYKLIEPSSTTSVLGLYFGIPIFVVVCLVLAYRVLSYCFPAFVNVITGGRSGANH